MSWQPSRKVWCINMQVADLISLLQNVDSEAEVRIAYQPTYPLYSGLSAWKEPVEFTDDEGNTFLYIGSGGSTGYLPDEVSSLLGWQSL